MFADGLSLESFGCSTVVVVDGAFTVVVVVGVLIVDFVVDVVVAGTVDAVVGVTVVVGVEESGAVWLDVAVGWCVVVD